MAKSPKMVMCRNCNTPIPQSTKVCPFCGAKNIKPFYKRAWFIVLTVVVVIAAVASISSGRNRGEKFVWGDLELSSILPEPKSNTGEILTDSKESLSIDIHKTSADEYKDYLDECQATGFTIENDKQEYHYTAFNQEGYELSLWYNDSDKELHINLDAPMEMGTLQWPTSEIAGLLPIPKSRTGSISWEASDGLFIYVGDTSKDDYAAYVDECSAKGFSVDYDKGDTYYYADNADGYHISLHYQGNNVMTIKIEQPKEAASENTVEAETPAASESEDAPSASESVSGAEGITELVDGMRPEFREAMDSYEAFFDEYIAFMDKYAESDGSDLSLLADYASYMSRYADMMTDFEAWNNEDMNAAEAAYYLEVQTRINQKLLEIAE